MESNKQKVKTLGNRAWKSGYQELGGGGGSGRGPGVQGKYREVGKRIQTFNLYDE